MLEVMIGVDPHKGSHTATMLDGAADELKRIKVRAGVGQVGELLAWAADAEGRTWAVESAQGMGYLLAQQLVAAGEHVVDVPATLASRVRVLGSGQSTKTDPNDARSVAIAALHAPALPVVRPADRPIVEGWIGEIGRPPSVLPPRRSIVVALPCMPTPRTIRGCSSDLRRPMLSRPRRRAAAHFGNARHASPCQS